MVFVEQTKGLRIALLCIHKLLTIPIQLPQMQQHHPLLDAVACTLLHPILICPDGMGRIALRQINIANSVIHLIQIFLVFRILRHRLQFADYLFRLVLRHRLAHLNAGIKLQFVGRISSNDFLEIAVSFGVMSDTMIKLS